MARTLGFSNRALRTSTDVPLILNRYSLPREFFEMAFRVLGAALVQALTQGMMPLAVLLNRVTAECFTLAIDGYVV